MREVVVRKRLSRHVWVLHRPVVLDVSREGDVVGLILEVLDALGSGQRLHEERDRHIGRSRQTCDTYEPPEPHGRSGWHRHGVVSRRNPPTARYHRSGDSANQQRVYDEQAAGPRGGSDQERDDLEHIPQRPADRQLPQRPSRLLAERAIDEPPGYEDITGFVRQVEDRVADVDAVCELQAEHPRDNKYGWKGGPPRWAAGREAHCASRASFTSSSARSLLSRLTLRTSQRSNSRSAATASR